MDVYSTSFSLDRAGDPGVIGAEDGNDIYVLSGDQPSPDPSGPLSWETEALPVSLTGESWAQVTMMDPEDSRSVDAAALAEEQSENNSSNSDIVHVEREEAELLEEGELQCSILGSESELAAVREADPGPVLPAEESIVTETPTPPAAPLAHQPEVVPAAVELQPLSPVEEHLLPDVPPQAVKDTAAGDIGSESAELPVLLYGGVALVGVAAALALGALAFRKK